MKGDLPKIINSGWKSAPASETITIWEKVVSFKDFVKTTNPLEKKMISAAKASLKYGIGYIIDQQGKINPFGKYYQTDQLPIYYVFAIDKDVFKVTKFKIGTKINTVKMESSIRHIITSIRRNKN